MNSGDLFVSTAVCAAGASGFAIMSVERPPKISHDEAERLIERQQKLVTDGDRANMNEVSARAVKEDYFKAVQRNSRAVGFLVDITFMTRHPTDGALLDAALLSYGAQGEFDPRDMLFSERVWPAGFGTCFLVDDDVVVTAAHVFCKDTGAHSALKNGKLRAVFGYEASSGGQAASEFREHRQVFAFEPRTVGCPPDAEFPLGDDWIRLKLTEPATVDGRIPLLISPDAPTINTPVYSLGHPNGVSLRYAHTKIQLETGASGFSAFLDAYNNSSGSPVFSADDHKVVGLVKFSSQPGGRFQVRGEDRYISQLCLPGVAQKATLCVGSAAFGP